MNQFFRVNLPLISLFFYFNLLCNYCTMFSTVNHK